MSVIDPSMKYLLPVLVLSASASLYASDWPRWRGAAFDDVSKETGLMKKWPAEGPRKLWSSDKAGLGYSGVSVSSEALYTLGLKEDTEILLAFDAASGAAKWATPVGPVLINKWGDGPRGTPTVDQDRVYALSGQGFLICVNAATGKQLWTTAMKDFGGKVPGWGYTESVLVDGNLVVCTPGGPQGTLLALDKMTGKKVWQSSEWTDGAQYSSVIAVTHNGSRQYIALTMQHFGGVDAKDGSKLWLADWTGRTAVIPTPIFSEGSVYVASGYGVGCKQVHIGPKNVVEDSWTNANMVNHHGGVILQKGYLYGYSDKGGWVCQDWKTGDVKWASKNLGKGAIHCADDMLYLLEESSGTVVLIDASPEGWSEHSRFKLDPQSTLRKPDGRVWTHPVVANGRLYLRDQEMLSCFEIQETRTASSGAATAVKFLDAEQAKQAALKLFPELGVAGSPLNQAFLARVQEARKSSPETFQDPNWPITVSRDVSKRR